VLAEEGGALRAVADIGTHWLDLVTSVTGLEVEQVCADLRTVLPTRRRPTGSVETFTADRVGEVPREDVEVTSEDAAGILLRLSGGARGVLTVSQVSPGRKNRLWFQVDTPTAGLAWDQEHPNDLWIGHRGEPNQDLMRDPALLAAGAAGLARYPGGHQEGWPDALRNLIVDFYAAVRAQRSGQSHEATFATFAQARAVNDVVDAIVQSHRTRAWVAVGLPEVVGQREVST
jgi:predicted dehydrogenase